MNRCRFSNRVLHNRGIRSGSPQSGKFKIYCHALSETGGKRVRSYVPKVAFPSEIVLGFLRVALETS